MGQLLLAKRSANSPAYSVCRHVLFVERRQAESKLSGKGPPVHLIQAAATVPVRCRALGFSYRTESSETYPLVLAHFAKCASRCQLWKERVLAHLVPQLLDCLA